VKAASVLLPALLLASAGFAGDLELHGHAKLQGSLRLFDDDDLGAAIAGTQVEDATLDLRVNTVWRRSRWDMTANTQLLTVVGDSPGAAAGDPGSEARGFLSLVVPWSDPHQWLDLDSTFSSTDSRLICARFDRLSIGFTGDRFVARLGRQALSWGGGLVFQVFDLFNPFAPTAIDTDYKPGTDMLSSQLLLDSGGDVQAIVVPRRPAPGRGLAADASSAAIKWHQFAGPVEGELLGARHYDDTVIGAGASGNLAGGVWRLNGTYTDLAGGGVTSLLANFSRAWVWGERNTNAFVEVFRNGFGVANLDRDLATLPAPLLERVGRGELFNLGRNELAAGIELEWTPLLAFEPTLLVNLDDHSSMLLLSTSFDWRQSLALDAGVQVGFGPHGTEYGGIPAGALFASTGRLVWVRLSRYF
jgi:hypothetical protein